MIKINDFQLTNPYCLTRIETPQQLHTFEKERKIKRSTKYLSDFQTILGNKATKIFEPDRYLAILQLEENNKAILAGLEHDPPNNIERIPFNPNLPTPTPDAQFLRHQWQSKDGKLRKKCVLISTAQNLI